MMQVFVLKFKTVSKLQLPVLMARHKSPSSAGGQSVGGGQTPTQDTDLIKSEDVKPSMSLPTNPATGVLSPGAEFRDGDDKKLKFGFPPSQAANYSVADCRALVKTLVCGVKTITWGCTSCKTDATPTVAGQPVQPGNTAAAAALSQAQKQFQPKETLVYIRLVKWAMEALDIYTLNTTTPPAAGAVAAGPATAATSTAAPVIGGAASAITAQQRTAPMQQAVRTKEEKEVLEHFAGVFALLHPQTFKEIFTQTIDYVVERIYKNYALQVSIPSILICTLSSTTVELGYNELYGTISICSI